MYCTCAYACITHCACGGSKDNLWVPVLSFHLFWGWTQNAWFGGKYSLHLGQSAVLKGLTFETREEWPTYLPLSSALALCPRRAAWTPRFVAQEVGCSLQPVLVPSMQSSLCEQHLVPGYENGSTDPVGPLPARSTTSLSLTAFRIFFWSRSWDFLYLALKSVMSFKIFS